MNAVEGLASLQEERSRAGARVSELETAWRSANAEVAVQSARISEAARGGAGRTTVARIENTLAAAKAKSQEPWADRVEGARAATRDVDRRIREHVAANLAELVTAIESEGAEAASRLNSAATELLAAAAEWRAAESRLAQTITLVGRPSPHDVSRPQAEEVTRAVAALVASGGEEGPTLDRTREPWNTLLGQSEAEVEFDAEAVPA